MSRDRSNSPVFRSRSRSPREWKRPERRGADRDRGNDRQPRDPHAKVRLYVSNLPYDVRWQDLKDIFREKVGSDISFIQLYDGPDGKPSGSGIVEVRSREVAMKTIDMLHRYEIKGRTIIVREEREKDRLRHEPMRHDSRSMDLSGGGGGGKPSLMAGSNLLGASAMGGAGMMNLLGAQSLVGGSLGAGLGGNGFNTQLFAQLGIEPSCITNQVFVSNLDYKVNVTKLEEIFKIAGNVIEAEIKIDKDGKSRGMGIVRFEHPMEAVQSIALFHGQCLFERQMGVRMDKMVDPIMQDIPRRLPAGLRGIGIGFGASGQPLLNIGEISNTLTLSILTGQFSSANLGVLGSSASALSTMGAVGSSLLNLGGGMSGMTGMGGGSMAGMLGSMGGSGSGLGGLSGGNSSSVGGGAGGLGMMGGAGSGFGGGGSSGLGGSMTSPLGGLGSGLSGLRGSSLGDSGMMSKGSGGGLSGGLGSLGGMSDGRMGSLAGDLYGSLGSSLSYDRGGNLDRIGSIFDRGLDRGDSYMRSSENSTIFVKNLPFSFSWQNLVDRFRDCGEIKLAEIKMENGRSRGCGLVQFLNPESARRAISLMNGARIEGRQIEVRLDRLI